MRERDIEALLTRLVLRRGGLCYKWISPGNNGVPDRIVILPNGRIIFVELKQPTGRLASVQWWQHRRLREHGCEVRTLWSPEQVQSFVKEVFGKKVIQDDL